MEKKQITNLQLIVTKKVEVHQPSFRGGADKHL